MAMSPLLIRKAKINLLGRFLIAQKIHKLEKTKTIILYRDAEKKNIEKAFKTNYKDTADDILNYFLEEYKDRINIVDNDIDIPVIFNVLDFKVSGSFFCSDFREWFCFKMNKDEQDKFIKDLKEIHPRIIELYSDKELLKSIDDENSYLIVETYTCFDDSDLIWHDNRCSEYFIDNLLIPNSGYYHSVRYNM